MSNKIRDIVDDMSSYIYNPNAIMERVLDTAQSVIIDGENLDLSEPGGPLIFLLEGAVSLTTAAIENDEKCCRKAYPAMATEPLELYNHMSDEDYYDRFGVPAPAVFTMIIGLQELKNRAVPPTGSGIRRVVIPRETVWEISGHTFSIQYPIELRVMPHGALQVLYDTTERSPIRDLSENTLAWSIQTINVNGTGYEYAVIQIPTLQYKITPFSAPITNGIAFNENCAFEDQFFVARIWNRVSGKWVEILTTHSPEVLDPLTPTAQLTVGDGVLNVKISDVYVRNGLIRGDIRIDVYSTRGKIDLDLRSYYDTEFAATYKDLNGITDTAYIEPLRVLTDVRYWCAEYIRAGRNALTFNELRSRVIDNSTGARNKPISENQLTATLADLGYTTLKSIDYVTQRIYHGSTPMPVSTLTEVSTPIGTMNGILQTSFYDLAKLPTVHNNGERMTISPDTLYVEKNGMIYIVEENGLTDFNGLPLVNRIASLNSNRYLHTPFHYVLDVNSEVFEARPYYLTSPKITGKRFVETNASMQLDVGVGNYSIELTSTGYKLLITTRSTDTYSTLPADMCGCQISYIPRGFTTQVAYLNGTFLGFNGEERVYEFDIKSNMDLDRNHDIIVGNFIMGNDDPNPLAMMLDVEMNVIFYTTGYTIDGYAKIDADTIVDDTAPGGNIMAVTHEVLQFNFGSYLENLWSNARTIVSPMEYVRYTEDVPALYTKDVYEIDPKTKQPIIVTVNGKKSLKYIHRVGDPILIDGKPSILHTANSVIYIDGKPVLKEPRKLQRRIELFLFDARYSVGNTDEITDYVSTTKSFILKGVLEDIPGVITELLEKTELYYYPVNTLGYVDVRLGNNALANMNAELGFNITYYVTDTVRKNTELLKALKKVTRSTIAGYLSSNRTISVSSVLKLLKEAAGDDIIDVEMDNIGDDKDQTIMTLRRDNDQFTLGKKAFATADGKIDIRDDISITFTRHTA